MNKIITSLGWMLIHSLWQGGILALLTASGLYLTRSASSFIHYRILLSALFAFITTCIITLCLYANYETGIASAVIYQADSNVTFTESAASIDFSLPFSLYTYISNVTHWLVFIWFLFFCYRMIIYGSGWLYGQRIRHEQVYNVTDDWQIRFEQLLRQMGIHQKVQLLESTLMQTPVTIGFLKPVILLPIGILCSLQPAQVEAVLRHELAHIRRHDYLVNLVQLITEAIFFFNPALLWISSQLREKREYCCDDIALKYIDNSEDFARALVQFKTIKLQNNSPALAFTRQPSQLRNRVLRILGDRISFSPVNTQVIICSLLAGLVLLALSFKNPLRHTENNTANPVISMADSITVFRNDGSEVHLKKVSTRLPVQSHKQQQKQQTPVPGPVIKMDSATLARLTGEFNTVYQNTHYIIGVAKSRITYLTVNGEIIAQENWPKYHQAFAGIIADYKAYYERSLSSAQEQKQNNKAADELISHAGSG